MSYAQLSSNDHLPLPDDGLQGESSGSRRTDGTTTHAFQLVKADGHRWLTLSLRSSAASPSDTPYFFGGDRVEGCVALDLKEPAPFRSIDVMVSPPARWPVFDIIEHGCADNRSFDIRHHDAS
jgi:hypothetical protein